MGETGVAPNCLDGVRVLDLDDLGTEPGERLGARGSRLKLGEIHDPHARKTIKFRTFYCCHCLSLLPKPVERTTSIMLAARRNLAMLWIT